MRIRLGSYRPAKTHETGIMHVNETAVHELRSHDMTVSVPKRLRQRIKTVEMQSRQLYTHHRPRVYAVKSCFQKE